MKNRLYHLFSHVPRQRTVRETDGGRYPNRSISRLMRYSGDKTEDFELRDSSYPNTVASVGSQSAAAVSLAVYTAGENLRNKLIQMAIENEDSPLKGAKPEDVEVQNGRMQLKDQSNTGETYADLMQRMHLSDLEAIGS